MEKWERQVDFFSREKPIRPNDMAVTVEFEPSQAVEYAGNSGEIIEIKPELLLRYPGIIKPETQVQEKPQVQSNLGKR